MEALLILLLTVVVLGFGFVLVMCRVSAGMRVGKSQLINPTDSPEEAQALGILIGEAECKPAVLRYGGSERKVGRVWLEHRTHYESTWLGFGARQVIDPDILLVMTVERSLDGELDVDESLRIDGRLPAPFEWSSGLPGFMKVSLRFEGEIPPAVTVMTDSSNACIVIPKPGV